MSANMTIPMNRHTAEGVEAEQTFVEFRMKNNGELTGIYDYKTNKPLTGVFGVEESGEVLFLKNGKPLSGLQTDPATGKTVYLLPDFCLADDD